jgi:hypothetical protein
MIKFAKLFNAFALANLVFSSMQGMFYGSIIPKSNHSQPKLLKQGTDLRFEPSKYMEIVLKNQLAFLDAKSAISRHLDKIESIEKLKTKLAQTTYEPIIIAFEQKSVKPNAQLAEHLINQGGTITSFTSKFLELKSLAKNLKENRDLKSIYSLLANYSTGHQNLNQTLPMTTGLTSEQFTENLNNALSKIDEQLIKNIGYKDQIVSDSTASLIRAKLKTKLMSQVKLNDDELLSLSSEITKLVNTEFINHVDHKWHQSITFPVFLKIESPEFKEQKIAEIKQEIDNYGEALSFILASQNMHNENIKIQKGHIERHLWTSIEKKVNDHLLEEQANLEFAKLSPHEQELLRQKFPKSSVQQLMLNNKLLALTHKFDQWQTGQFQLSDLLTVPQSTFQLFNQLKNKTPEKQAGDKNLWLKHFREQLKNTQSI